MNGKTVIIIGSQPLGTPIEIQEALHGNNQVIVVSSQFDAEPFKIVNYNMQIPFIKPLTRKERRKLSRKK